MLEVAPVFFLPSVSGLALILICAMHQHLSACLSSLSVSFSAPVLAASTSRADIAEYIIYVYFFCLFCDVQFSCLFRVTCVKT